MITLDQITMSFVTVVAYLCMHLGIDTVGDYMEIDENGFEKATKMDYVMIGWKVGLWAATGVTLWWLVHVRGAFDGLGLS